MNRMRPRPSQPSQGGRTDLLLRLFDSQFFDAWLALTYIYQKKTGGVHDYLCNKLYELPERDIERYLSQFCQLIITRPGSALERVIIDLCARSLRIGVKIFWLFKAICQDQPKNRHAWDMMDKCEVAVLNGSWVLPFKNCTLEPISPRDGTPLPPTPVCASMTPKTLTNISMEDLDYMTPSHQGLQLQNTSSSDINQPFSPVCGGSASLCSSHDIGQGLEGLIGASPSFPKSHAMDLEINANMERTASEEMSTEAEVGLGQFERCRALRAELGKGEGVTELLERSSRNAREGGTGCVSASEDDPMPPPSSPRLRKTTFGATLDFVDALCNASTSLVQVPQNMREKALRQTLMDINSEIDLCASKNVAVWFPMGIKNERVLRLVANDAVILNSREKVPFMLYVEVLQADGAVEDGEVSEAEQYADSAHSIMHMRSDSHDRQSGISPLSHQELAGPLPEHHYLGTDQGQLHEGGEASRSANRPHNGRTLSESSAWKGETEPDQAPSPSVSDQISISIPQATPLSFSRSKPPPAPSHNSTLTGEEIKELKRAGVRGLGDMKNSFTRRIDTAMAGLRGDAPLVKLNLTVLEDVMDEEDPQPAGRQDSEDIIPPGANAAAEAAALGQKDDEGMSTSKALALLSKFGLCRTTCLDLGINGEWYSRGKGERRCVAVSLEVIGGVNLRIPSPSRRRRVPSQEALDYLADKMKMPNLPAAGAQFPLDVTGRTWSDRSEASSRISITPSTKDVPVDDLRSIKKQKQANEVYGLRWIQKVSTIREQSPHGRRKGWACRCVIVKSGDDCRQELLAIQLIQTFQDIFHEAKIPLWVRPYEVLVTSNRTALIEFIPDSLSIHTIKNRSSHGTSLSQHFFNKFKRGTPECARAQRSFVESVAAYSIISYLLQFKDRHNGNLLLDDDGHLIHIDFGFILGLSPGGVNFEAAPFKLTREFLEIMDSNSEGKASEAFDYFKVLFIQGFLACRKHADRIITMCEMMSKAGFPCFKMGDRVLKNLKKRFHLNCPEEQSIQVVMGLTSDSLDAWRTRQYDYYQRLLNGIL